MNHMNDFMVQTNSYLKTVLINQNYRSKIVHLYTLPTTYVCRLHM